MCRFSVIDPAAARRCAGRFALLAILLAGIVVPVAEGGNEGTRQPLRVAAAISLREALTAIAADDEARGASGVELFFGSSGQLLAQIRNGAPIDAFISAGREQVDLLERERLVVAGSRQVVATNRLALVVERGNPRRIESIDNLSRSDIARIAAGEPRTVPAGQYAAQVLDSLGLAERLSGKLTYGTNVRQVLEYVATGEAAAGFVYVTDALAAGAKVEVVAVADPAWHEPIEYPVVVLAASRQADAARRFIAYLTSAGGRDAFERFGFSVPWHEATTAPANGDAGRPVRALPAAGVSNSPRPDGRMNEALAAVRLSLAIATIATAAVAVVAVPVAYWMARRRFRGQSVLETLLTFPLVLPPTVVGYSIVILLGSRGLLGRPLADLGYSMLFRPEAAVLAAALVSFPLLYLPAKAAFHGIEAELHEMAALLGASPWQAFWHVSLPIAAKGIFSGVLLCFARALGEFGATVMVFGWRPGRLTMPIAVYSAYEQGELSRAVPIVLAMIGICFALLVVLNRVGAPSGSPRSTGAQRAR